LVHPCRAFCDRVGPQPHVALLTSQRDGPAPNPDLKLDHRKQFGPGPKRGFSILVAPFATGWAASRPPTSHKSKGGPAPNPDLKLDDRKQFGPGPKTRLPHPCRAFATGWALSRCRTSHKSEGWGSPRLARVCVRSIRARFQGVLRSRLRDGRLLHGQFSGRSHSPCLTGFQWMQWSLFRNCESSRTLKS
jgi:hypothetical protein